MLEESFGILPLRQEGEEWQVLLVQHRGGHWAFPKGHAEEGESARQTAERELLEETRLTVSGYLSLDPIEDCYTYFLEGEERNKKVVYFFATVAGEVKLQENELSDYTWASFKEAEHKVTFPETKDLCRRSLTALGG